jgi:L-rhamnose mutarotase
MEHVCFTLQVRPEQVAEYRRRHAEVWPEMRQALWDAGWRNYRIYLRDDGLVVGHFETEDYERALAEMDGLAVNTRWQESMAPLVVTAEGRRVDQSLDRLEPIFALTEPPSAR